MNAPEGSNGRVAPVARQAAPPPGPVYDLVDFPELWRTINRYKWGVLAMGLIAAVLAALWAFRAEPVYRGSLTIMIEPRPTRAVQSQEVYDPGIGTDEYFGTQYQILRSRSIARRVIQRMDLTTHPEFVEAPSPSLYQRMYEWLDSHFDVEHRLAFLPPPNENPQVVEDAEALMDRAILRFQRALVVEPMYGSQMIRVHFESSAPELAAMIANTVGDVFIESGLEMRLDATERTSKWLTDTLADLRNQLQQSEVALQNFREREGLVDAGGMRRLLEEEVAETSQRLRESQRVRTQLANTYWRIQQAGNDATRLEDISALLLDPVVQRAKEDVLEARSAMRQARERYGTRHPQMTAARAEMENAQTSYHNQLMIAAEGVKAEFEIARENEKALAESLESARNQLRQLDRQAYEVTMVERDVQTNRELYEMFLTRFRETDTIGEYQPLNARVIDGASTPREPHRPRKSRIIVLGGLFGLMVGLVLAVIRHLLDEGIRGVEEMEGLTGAPVLGILPVVGGIVGKKDNMPYYFAKNPRKPYSEGVRSIRASIQLNDVDRSLKRLLVTSSIPGEGKTSLAGSLAEALGAMESVVLVEADLRAPTLRKIFKIPMATPDLMQVLMGEATVEEALAHQEQTGIKVLAVESPPKNPAEVVASQAFARLINELARRFDRVVIDSPPCQAASDAAILARISDGVIFVVKSETTNRRAVKAAYKQLRQVDAPIFGNVINQVDVRKNREYYGSYYYAYGYYGRT